MSDEQNTDNIANLRKAADDGAAARKVADQLARENAMLRAGVDLDSKAGAYFAKGYDGELTTEAIKAEAADFSGVLRGESAPPAAPPAEEKPPVDENQSRERMDLASNSGAPGTTPGEDPYKAAESAFNEALGSNGSREKASAAAFSALIQAANAGDKRVIL